MYLSSCFTCFNLITVVVKLISYKFFKQIFKEFKHIIEYFKLQAEYNILCFIFFSHSCCVVACREKYELHSWLEQTHTVFFHCKKKKLPFFSFASGGSLYWIKLQGRTFKQDLVALQNTWGMKGENRRWHQ